MYLWRTPGFLTPQITHIGYLIFAGQAGHAGIRQPGFRISNIYLRLNPYPRFSAFLVLFWLLSIVAVTVTALPDGRFGADATAAF